jgi:hypothetical protein
VRPFNPAFLSISGTKITARQSGLNIPDDEIIRWTREPRRLVILHAIQRCF